jgi:hypothetical protein
MDPCLRRRGVEGLEVEADPPSPLQEIVIGLSSGSPKKRGRRNSAPAVIARLQRMISLKRRGCADRKAAPRGPNPKEEFGEPHSDISIERELRLVY